MEIPTRREEFVGRKTRASKHETCKLKNVSQLGRKLTKTDLHFGTGSWWLANIFILDILKVSFFPKTRNGWFGVEDDVCFRHLEVPAVSLSCLLLNHSLFAASCCSMMCRTPSMTLEMNQLALVKAFKSWSWVSTTLRPTSGFIIFIFIFIFIFILIEANRWPSNTPKDDGS